ncbi:ricin B lectin domain-containing protein [Cokeromyces recurvatus]|uniref:ricin B lectin domain-containing protein n=1 Tax=Cokeromyces recurvatus TaxID=90255 RepID=UPI00221E5CB2|nr:ricin B lectin domain-containing protein [Cokeromyces recurvatus]KAI7901544.1 ricin B lectin domain-containing protein [Cokeromyces recurvatus]
MTTGFPQRRYFYIKSRKSNACIDVYMGETTPDSSVIIWPQKGSDDNDNQLWRFDDGFLINKKSNLVMDIRGGDLKSDKPIVQYDRKMTMAHNQRWGYRDGYIYCLADPRLVLDIKGGGSKEGTKVILYKRKENDNDNQQWIIEPFGEPLDQRETQKPIYGGRPKEETPYNPPQGGGAAGISSIGNASSYSPASNQHFHHQEYNDQFASQYGRSNQSQYSQDGGNNDFSRYQSHSSGYGNYGPPDDKNPMYRH